MSPSEELKYLLVTRWITSVRGDVKFWPRSAGLRAGGI